MEEEQISPSAKKISRLGICEVCNVNLAKYTCPQCELKTCCLDCVNIHKNELNCDGVRNKVKFVPLQKFSNLELQNDFIMLEQISNSLFKYKRDPVKNAVSMYNKLPFPLHILRKHAYMRKIQLKFLPKLFTKHTINTSCVSKNKLYWRIEWVFVSSNIKCIDEKLLDTTRLCLALKKHIDKPDLAFYKSAGINALLVLLKLDRSTKFHILDNNSTITEALKNKCIIEFPIFYVIFKYEKDMFDIQHDELQLDQTLESTIKEDIPMEEKEINNLCKKVEAEDSLDIDMNVSEDKTNNETNDYFSISYEYDY